MTFTDYFGSFDYYISTPLFNSVPSQVKRDHDLIMKENKQLSELLKVSGQRSTLGVNVGEICGAIANCNIDNSSAEIALTQLIKNNQEILRLYRALITDDAFTTSDTAYILVESSFKNEMSDHYNAATLNACSQCKWEFWDTLESITDMSARFKDIGNSTQVWQDTWNLLWSGEDTPAYRSLEKELLSDYLEWEWVSTQQADIMLGNLERANAWGLSSSNPLVNSMKGLEETANSFEESIQKWFDELFGERETVPYIELSRIKSEVQTSESISQNIATLYENEVPFAVVQDTSTQTLQARIIQMHFSLVRTANLLEKKIPDAEKICNKQWKDLGRCDFDLILR